MFEKSHHQRIEAALRLLRLDALNKTNCFFGGGTAIALQTDEYRQSDDIGFLCNDAQGYRAIQQGIFYHAKEAICQPEAEIIGEIRRSRDAIRFFINPDGALPPIKVEIIREGYLSPFLPGKPYLGTLALQPVDLIATKLLANADRGLGSERHFRDYFDIVIACARWPDSAAAGFSKAKEAYGHQVTDGIKRVHALLQQSPRLLGTSFEALQVAQPAQKKLFEILKLSPDKAIQTLSEAPCKETTPDNFESFFDRLTTPKGARHRLLRSSWRRRNRQ